jgi:hypothetical protein
MRNATGGGVSVQSDGRIEGYRASVSGLAAPIEYVRRNLKLLDAAIASELPPGEQDVSANVAMLHDLTPSADAAPNAGAAGHRA